MLQVERSFYRMQHVLQGEFNGGVLRIGWKSNRLRRRRSNSGNRQIKQEQYYPRGSA
jgi:hypothetical protein